MPYTRDDIDSLEAILDRIGIEDTVSALAQICYEKESHVLENWQDQRLASRWEKLGRKLQKLAPTLIDPNFM